MDWHGPRNRLLISMPSLMADWQDDIGYKFLKDTLGPSLPRGTGIQVSQVEASESGTTLKYAPQAGAGTFNGTGFHYTGKTFPIQSGATTASGHASTVARFFYGNNTNPASGPASIAPGVSSIHNYVAGHPSSATGFLDHIESNVHIDGEFDESQKKRLSQIATRCPVHKTLANGVEFKDNATFA